MSALGLYLADDGVTAVRLEDDGAAAVRHVDTDGAAEALADWLRAAGSRIGAAFGADLRLRSIEFPFTQPGKIRQVLPLQLEDHLPGPSDQFEQQIQVGRSGDKGLAVVQLLPRDEVERARLALLALTPNARALEADALLVADSLGDAETTLVWTTATTTTLVRSQASGQRTGASIPIGAARLADEAAAANLVARLRSLMQAPPTRLRLGGDPAGVAALEPLLRALYPDCTLDLPADDEDWRAYVAGLAASRAQVRQRPQWNLAPRRPLLSPELTQSGILPAVALPLALMLLVAVFATAAGTRALRAQADAYRSEVTAIFERNFPRTRIVDPVRQMQSVVDRAGNRAQAAGAGKVIDGLTAFHEQITDATGLMLAELRSAAGSWTLRGDAPDYSGVERIKKAVEGVPTFKDVRVQRAEQTADKSAIRFALAWSEQP